MVSFSTKQMDQQKTLSEILIGKRLELNFELEDVENILKINKRYLFALENGQYNEILPDVYTKNFIRRYAKLLGLNIEEIVKLYLFEKELFDKARENIKTGLNVLGAKNKKKETGGGIITPRKIKIFFVILAVFIFIGYLGWQVKNILRPPYLEIIQPGSDSIVSTNSIAVIGRTESETVVNINQEEAGIDAEGEFTGNIYLQEGLNTIRISAKKKHGKENVIYRQVIYEPSKKD